MTEEAKPEATKESRLYIVNDTTMVEAKDPQQAARAVVKMSVRLATQREVMEAVKSNREIITA